MSETIDLFNSVENKDNESKNVIKNYELKDLLDLLKKEFECSSNEELFQKFKESYTENQIDFYSKLKTIIGNSDKDYIRMIYQYYLSDRENNKQDFTPETLSQLVAKIAIRDNDYTVLDCCAGTGALTIQASKLFPNKKFTLLEKDENTIPFLFANTKANDISAEILHYDVIQDNNLDGPIFDSSFECDCCISNPPFNLKWVHPLFAAQQPRFNIALPPEQNANYTFLLTAMSHTKNVGAFILPQGVTTSDPEKNVRKALLKNNLLEAVISIPGGTFESTDIPTVILVINKHKQTRNVCFIKLDNFVEQETRMQKGQFGGASHTNRTYEKTVNIIPEKVQQKVLTAIKTMQDEPNFSICIDADQLISNDSNINPKSYIKDVVQKNERKFREIGNVVADLNKISKEKNRLKLTINENAAKCFGNKFFTAIAQIEASNKIMKQINDAVKEYGIELQIIDPVKISKDKNVIRIEQNSDDDGISSILSTTISVWTQHYFYLNQEENNLLAELRDILLDRLMQQND